MRESLGGSLLLNIVIMIVAVIIIFFVGILTYTKAYKIKNRIIEVIEEYGNYSYSNDRVLNDAVSKINADLSGAGYDSSAPTRCNSARVQDHLREMYPSGYSPLPANLNNYGYNYCVFEIFDKVSNGKYYVVVTFVKFEFPVIGRLLTIPVYGETKILGKDYNY